MAGYMITASAALADLTPASAEPVTVTPIPASDVPGVHGVAVVLDSTPDADPDVILSGELTDTANAAGEVSFTLYPSASVLTRAGIAQPEALRYRFGWPGGRAVTVRMPAGHVRLREAPRG